MIRTVRIRGFKRFREVEFRLPGHVVLAGPNNTGKTTMLQAVASWDLALRRWKDVNSSDLRWEHRGVPKGKRKADVIPRPLPYRRVPIARQAFSAVPLRNFDLLWRDRRYESGSRIEIELQHDAGWSVAMEFIADSTEQIYVRPSARVPSETLRTLDLRVVFVPPMTGLGIDEPVFQPAKIEQLLGLGRPGEVVRNLLSEAHANRSAWNALQASIKKLFDYELLPPDASGAHIRAEYRTAASRRPLDVASAGSGFQQVLMLLAFLNTRENAVLLLDEPDAHLHVILQDAIYHELRTVAARQRSQLIVATHSEVIINSVEPRELCITLDEPRLIADTRERTQLISSLRVAEQCGRDAGAGRPGRSLCRGLHGHRHPAGLGRGARTPGVEAAHDRVDVESGRLSGAGGRSRWSGHQGPRSFQRVAARTRGASRARASRR